MTPSHQSSAAAHALTRIAYLYAIRRDRDPETRLALLKVVEELHAEAELLEFMTALARVCGGNE